VKSVVARTLRSLQNNILAGILAGILTIGPLFVTYLIFSFLFGVDFPRIVARTAMASVAAGDRAHAGCAVCGWTADLSSSWQTGL